MDTREAGNALGEFLRARRELVRPEDVGMRSAGIRRVSGLRREEVAMLAGISADYYLRLEQGRDRTPSTQVLDALADVLRLDEAGAAHLRELARPKSRRRPRPKVERVPASIQQLVRSLTMPAFVQNKYMDVLAANPLAVALSPHLAPGCNRLRALFTDPEARRVHPDWEQGTAEVVAQLRAVIGGDTEDPRLAELIGELSLASERFRRLWARHDIRRRRSATTRLSHPQVGELILHRDKLAVTGTDNLVIVVYHAEPGTPSAQALALLGSLITAG
ncbi:helix-turn-helix domain-containing protein [Kutzneria sp. CA-103260]|uniref:helix-turn-helix domain-containing protein n=1 Tax=Kutzneria sp. CA-103260 TaxID=2802641 RepID=UPI001BA9301E|nr:helix-turn-helix transcriptional regulator [Kutzneria sp. CA-103260]QUQ67017.1 XRE family transcriptional regulator [Kutzneria sp. CA-103260]